MLRSSVDFKVVLHNMDEYLKYLCFLLKVTLFLTLMRTVPKDLETVPVSRAMKSVKSYIIRGLCQEAQ